MITKDDLFAAMDALAERRPVFHVEADFQHALAWVIHECHPGIDVRLERPVTLDEERGHADIWLRDDGGDTVVELKYWTRSTGSVLHVDGEDFPLRDQGAQPLSRYDFWRDVRRMERLISEGHAGTGYGVALTNVQNYWNAGQARVIDATFRIHEGHEVSGVLAWRPDPPPSAGTTVGRESPIHLSGRYVANWRDYSSPEPGLPGGEFRYLLLDVGEALGTPTGRASP